MIKTLLVLTGAVLLAVPAVHAQQHRYIEGRSALEHGAAIREHGYGRGYGRRPYGRYYYYGGIPYFFPYDDFAFGFGYPGYYAGWYGGPYGNGYGGAGYPGAYEGRITNEDDGGDRNAPDHNGPSLPQAVQRQLSKKGYYKGTIDGQFGPASRSALSRFQREHGLKETGRIDEPTLDALGFTDRAPN